MITPNSPEQPPGTGRRPATIRTAIALALVPAVLLTALVVAFRFSTDGLLPGDAATHAWALLHRPTGARTAARVLTASGTGAWPYLIVVTAGLATGRTLRDRIRRACLPIAALAVGQAVRFAIAEAIARPRPPRADWATHASGFSMPSGHTTSAALATGLLCLILAHRTPPLLRWAVSGFAVAWAVCVGLTRVYLGVHWASDVIAGWLLAIAFLALCTIVSGCGRGQSVASPETAASP